MSPNPAKDVLYINTTSKEAKRAGFVIYNVKGQMIKSGELFLKDKESISVSDLLSGVYEIKITSDKSNIAYKFIKE